MSAVLANYTTQDAYTDAGTLHQPFSERVQVQVANAGVFFQLDTSGEGSGQWGQEEFMAKAIGSLSRRCSGIRFRSAAAGVPAQVSATLLNARDLAAGSDSLAPFDTLVTAEGAVTGLPMVRVFRSTNQSIPSGAVTAISFDTVEYDTAGMFDLAQPTRLTLRQSGKYRIGGHAAFAASASGTYRTLQVQWVPLGSRPALVRTSLVNIAGGADFYELVVATEFEGTKGQAFELSVSQATGAALNVQAIVDRSPVFYASYIGP